MPVNLVDAARSLFNNQLITKASVYLDESETGVAKAITGILPIVFQELVNKTFTHEGAGIVAQLAGEQQHSGMPDSWEDIVDNGNFLQKGTRLLNSFFDNRVDVVTGLLSNFSGLTVSSVVTLLSMAVPAVLGVIGKHLTGGASGVAGLLNSQKDNIAAAMPAGLNSSTVPGGWSAETHVNTPAATIINDIPETVESNNNLRILLPILLLMLAALGAFYLFGKWM